MENDKFLVTKKVAVDKLPDPKDRRAQINDQIPIKIERSAAEMHEAYLARIQELKLRKQEDDEKARIREAQDSLIRNFVKKPTFATGGASNDGGEDTSVFGARKASKNSGNLGGTTPLGHSIDQNAPRY